MRDQLNAQASQIKDILLDNFANQKLLIMQRQKQTRYLMSSMLAGLVTLYIIVGFFLWQGSIHPIATLTQYLNNNKIEKTRFNIPFLRRRDEIGDFARAFAEMVRRRSLAELQLREHAEELLVSKEEADQANTAKSQFLANMSHELRTPLNSIIGIVQVIKGHDLNAKQKNLFEIIAISSQNLLKIVNDILDLSRIEAGEVDYEYTVFDLNQNIAQAVESLHYMAAQKGLSLTLDNFLRKDLYVLGDPLRFSRIVINLVNNAIRYTQRGSVIVKVSSVEVLKNTERIKIDVIDTGIGIPANRIDTIFEKFTQGDSSTTRKFGGTGLGLAITKELLQIMDGSIAVKSAQDVGSTFTVEIPFEFITDLERIAQSQECVAELDHHNHDIRRVKLAEAHILLAEDQEMNIVFMRHLFKDLGIENYTIATTGIAVLEVLKERHCDLILMDCHMPEMNGYEAAEYIRADRDPQKSNIPIIAMTANVMQKDIDHCFEIGMNEHLGKPFDLGEFKDKIQIWIDMDDNVSQDSETKIPESAEGEDLNDGAPVDLTNLKQNTMNDDELLKEMVEIFIRDSRAQIENLRNNCDTGINDNWVEAAHALKGLAGSVGAKSMRGYCETAQNMNDSQVHEREETLRNIEIDFALVEDYLQDLGVCSIQK